MGPLLGGLLAGGASLISGLFGRDSAKKQQQLERDLNAEAYNENVWRADMENALYRARADAAALVPVRTATRFEDHTTEDYQESGGVDMGAFLKAANDAGFNPLSFLRSGAMSLFATRSAKTTRGGYTETFTETTGERAFDAAMVGFGNRPIFESIVSQGMTRVPSSGEVFGNALVAGTNQFISAQGQLDQNNFQKSLVQMQLSAAQQRDAMRGGRSFYVPSSYQHGGTTTTTPGKTSSLSSTPGGSPGDGYVYLPSLNAWVKQGSSLTTDNPNEYAQFIDAVDAGTNDFLRVMRPPTRQPDGTYKPNPNVFKRPLSGLTTDWLDYYSGGEYTKTWRPAVQEWFKTKQPQY